MRLPSEYVVVGQKLAESPFVVFEERQGVFQVCCAVFDSDACGSLPVPNSLELAVPVDFVG